MASSNWVKTPSSITVWITIAGLFFIFAIYSATLFRRDIQERDRSHFQALTRSVYKNSYRLLVQKDYRDFFESFGPSSQTLRLSVFIKGANEVRFEGSSIGRKKICEVISDRDLNRIEIDKIVLCTESYNEISHLILYSSISFGFLLVAFFILFNWEKTIQSSFLSVFVRQGVSLPESIRSKSIDSIVGHIEDRLAELRLQKNQIEQAERERNMAMQVAHDIKPSIGTLNYVLADSAIGEEKRSLGKLTLLRVQEVLSSIQKNNQPVFESVNITKLAKNLQAQKATFIKEVFQLVLEISNDGPDIFWTVNLINFERTLANLIDNAISASLAGSKIRIILGRTFESETLSIVDSGKGIPAEFLSRIGEKGATFGKSGGSGLGIYFAKANCKDWGIDFTILSQPGQGTTITLSRDI